MKIQGPCLTQDINQHRVPAAAHLMMTGMALPLRCPDLAPASVAGLGAVPLGPCRVGNRRHARVLRFARIEQGREGLACRSSRQKELPGGGARSRADQAHPHARDTPESVQSQAGVVGP
jgi:hypothetical protein